MIFNDLFECLRFLVFFFFDEFLSFVNFPLANIDFSYNESCHLFFCFSIKLIILYFKNPERSLLSRIDFRFQLIKLFSLLIFCILLFEKIFLPNLDKKLIVASKAIFILNLSVCSE